MFSSLLEDPIVALFWDYLRQHSWAVDVLRLSLDQLKQVIGGQIMGQAPAERTVDFMLDEDAASSARRLSTWKGWWPTLRRIEGIRQQSTVLGSR